MIQWIKRQWRKLFGKRAESAPHVFTKQYGNTAAGSIVGRDLVVISGKSDGGRSVAAEVIGKEVVLTIKPPAQQRTKKQKKLSREQRRKQKAAGRG